MNRLNAAVEDYLALRHGLGFTLKDARLGFVKFSGPTCRRADSSERRNSMGEWRSQWSSRWNENSSGGGGGGVARVVGQRTSRSALSG